MKVGITSLFLLFFGIVSNTDPVTAQTISTGGAGGEGYSFAICKDGTLWSWGRNRLGSLGDGTTIDRYWPVQVTGLTNIIAVAGGNGHCLALRSDSTVWSWGYNAYGQVGDSTTVDKHVPVQVKGLDHVIAIVAGDDHSLAIRDDSTLWSWGLNSSGELGDGTTINRTTPVRVSSLAGVISIAAGWEHSVALKSDSTVWTWGGNTFGELGDGTTVNKKLPLKINSLTGSWAIGGGLFLTLAIQKDSTVWTCGRNTWGQLGNGTKVNSSIPVHVLNIKNIIAVCAASGQSLALRNDSTVWAFGYNGQGALGDGTNINDSVPAQTLISGVKEIAAGMGEVFSLARKGDGSVWGWGNNSYGNIGDSTTIDRNVPVQTYLICSSIPHPFFTSSDTSFCDETGKCIDFTDHSINSPTSWQWFFPGATPVTSTQQNPTNICYYTPGTYAVKLIVSNANGTDTLDASPLIVFSAGAALPVLTFSGDTIFCNHAVSYQWYFNGSPIPGATDSFYVATQPGNYSVQITDENGCTRLSNGILSNSKELNSGQLVIYPNPVKESLIISNQLLIKGEFEIYNVIGEKVYSDFIKSKLLTINCRFLPSGVYFIKISSGDQAYIRKFVKE